MPKKTSQRSLEWLASFADTNPRPIVEVDFDGNISYINKAAESQFPDLKKLGKKHPYLFDIQKVIEMLKNESAKSNVLREVTIGNELFRQSVYYFKEFNCVRIYGSNATKKLGSHLNFRESEKRYYMLFDKMNYAYGLQDIIFENGKPVDYRFVDVNSAFEKLGQLVRKNIVGKTLKDLTPPNSKPTEEEIETRKKYDEVALTGKPLYMESYNAKQKKHFKIYVYKPNDNQICLLFRDITKEKKIEEAKDSFISIMSHELRNPLTPILANAQLLNLLLERQPNSNPLMQEAATVIGKQAAVMADILNDMLDVSRMHLNKVVLEKKKINLCEVVETSVNAAMPFITAKQQKVSLSWNQNPIFGSVDSTRMEQVLVNLINNASKYTQEGGHIEVRCEKKGKKIMISVKDNGRGIDKDKASRIFELFSEGSESFFGIGGLGIGLSIVKNLVLLHGGTVEVRSKGDGKGSEFIVMLPALSAAESVGMQAKDASHESLDSRQGKSRVMIVEDNEAIRNSISHMLRFHAYETKTAERGGDALGLYETFRPDVALIDIGLPDMNGYKVAELLKKAHEKGKGNLTLIAFTGYGQEKDKDRAKKAGFDYHITKPVDMNQLLELLKNGSV
jgi:signal transduction histidine kinase/CheY-like chemotaxis protein